MPGRAELCSEHRPGFSVSLIFTSTGHSLRGFPLWGTDGVSEPAKVRAKPDRSVLTVVLPSPSTQLGMASHLPLGHLPKTRSTCFRTVSQPMWSENGLWSEANPEPLIFHQGERGQCEQRLMGRQDLREGPRIVRTGKWNSQGLRVP